MPTEEYKGVAVVPGEQHPPETTRPSIDMTPLQADRAKYVSIRMGRMEAAKAPYIASKRRALKLFDGHLEPYGPDIPADAKDEVVAPLARIFVEAKTAKEVRAFSDFVINPKDDEDDAWRAELLMQAVDHVRTITMARPKRHELLRMKNIIGVSIKWKGFRSTTVKMNVTKAVDDDGIPTEWEEKDVPGESDIFEEVIDPFLFYVDPNATNMNDALDCAMYFSMSAEEFTETFGNAKLFDIKGVEAGANGEVEGLMYFKKPSGRPDMFCVYAWPSAGLGVEGMKPGHVKEVFYGGLLDEHKMLPFVSYHNVPKFSSDASGATARTSSGEPATASATVTAKQKFWAYAGDPEVIMDLIDLRTGFTRNLYKACDLASRSLVLTDGNFRMDNSTDWQHGAQVIGGKGKVEGWTPGAVNVAAFQITMDDIYLLCIQATGVDPRNLTDTKEKTLGETLSQKEESAQRVDQGVVFNEEIAEVRDGKITHELIQQHYTNPKMVRLTGAETEEQLKKFDEVEGEHPRTGKPLIGKRYRRITTKMPLKELAHGAQKKLRKEDTGTYSFIARPEYIRTSEMDITVTTKRRAGEVQALVTQQAAEGINMYSGLLALAQPSPTGGQPILSGSIKDKIVVALDVLIDKHLESMNIKGKAKVKGGTDEKVQKVQEAFRKVKEGMKPVSQLPPTE
jgi:hypothetical protein